MVKNYFKTAWRNFKKNKIITLINVFGLSIGITAALIIYLIIQYNFNFDRYEPDKERIYRIVTENENSKNPGVPAPLHEALQNKVTGIEKITPIFQYYDWNAKVTILEEKRSVRILKKQQNIAFADKNYFSLFPHEWVQGNPSTSLNNPYQLVLTESRAHLYFPGVATSQLIGRTVIFSDSVHTIISGIIKDLKANSDFEYKAFISLSTIPYGKLTQNYNWDNWGATSSVSQVMIKIFPGVKPEKINAQIKAILKERIIDKDAAKNILRLQSLSDIHTNTDFDGKINQSAINGLILLVIFLLLLGCINFINLSTAMGSQRAKEIGIRKTFGSKKSQLVFQFLTETFLLTLFTTALSSVLVSILLSSFIPDGLQSDRILNLSSVFIFLSLLIFLVTILAGIYPAFILSGFQPVRVLKNQAFANSGANRAAWIRKTLVVFQFVVAQIFILAVIVINKQVHYSLQKDMGFRKDAIINFKIPDDSQNAGDKKFVLREALRKIPEIQNVIIGGQSPAFSGQMSNKISFKQNGKEINMSADIRSGDTAYLSFYNIPLIAGRNVLPADTATELLINETLAAQLEFKQPADALGHYIFLDGRPLPIVGVMVNFNQASVRNTIHPLIFYAARRYGNIMHVALQKKPDTWKNAIGKIQTAWKNIYPDADFDYSFLDTTIRQFYKQEQMLSGLLTFSATVAILISCMGLLGLVIFITNSRTQEIGIRKVLGASVLQIIRLLSGNFVRLTVLAFVIAVPLAWFLIHAWLQSFAYHTVLSWWIFLLGGSIMIMISLTVVCMRAIKAALANPVKSLRTE